MTCTDKPVCVVGNRLVTLNELFGLIIDLYPKKINHLIRWKDHLGMELRNFKWLEKTLGYFGSSKMKLVLGSSSGSI